MWFVLGVFGAASADVSDSTELEFGFPTSREELYRYRGLIIGSVEASFFTHDQLQMIQDFVSKRGGGVLFLGGQGSFAEGGWAGTSVEEARAEIAVLETYLPAQLSREEIAGHAQAAIEEVGATSPKQMGDVMRVLMPRLKGQADGKLVNEVVRELLASGD